MTKYLFIIIVVFATSCSQPKVAENNTPKTEKQNPGIPIKTTPFKNPALIYGSSFGIYFQSLFKLAKYEEMINFTSKQTINKYGKAKLVKIYSQLDFAFPLKLKNLLEDKSSGIIQMTYETTIIATTKIFSMNVKVENDSVKLVSCDLKGFPSN